MEEAQTFQPSPESVGSARRFVRATLADTVVDLSVAELLTSELASNAVVHARGPFRVRVRTCTRTVRIEVENHRPELLAIVREPSRDHGRGLNIIEQLALRWGADSGPEAKVVWFELPTAAADTR
jgi:anti-sigma regulatory factor (Ser/Thr protein kinase)